MSLELVTTPGEAPTSPAAEWATIAQMMTKPAVIADVIGIPLAIEDFSQPETRLLFGATVERHYASKSIDPLIVGEIVREDLANYWSADPNAVAQLLTQRVRNAITGGDVHEHAGIVKRLATARKLMDACNHAIVAIGEGRLSPEEIGDKLGAETLAATAGSIRRSEILDWMETGRAYVRHLAQVVKAREQGLEVGVYTGLPFIDDWTTGIGPGELCFLAGEPGIGKTAIATEAALGYAARQLQRPQDKRIGTLFLSCEMNLESSTARIVSRLTGIDGMTLREGRVDQRQFQRILTEWKNRENLPLYWNFASNFRLSQMRALIAEAIRRFNVGFVVLDHFRMVDTDRKYQNGLDADEAKVRFLKENIAKDLNVAVMCLAHTIKVGRGIEGDSRRPRMSDLRGSGQIAAHADFIAMAWNPNPVLTDDDDLPVTPDEGDYELLWVKNRFGPPAGAAYRFIGNEMRVTPR